MNCVVDKLFLNISICNLICFGFVLLIHCAGEDYYIFWNLFSLLSFSFTIYVSIEQFVWYESDNSPVLN